VNPLSRLNRYRRHSDQLAEVSAELAVLREQMAAFIQTENDHQQQAATLYEALDQANKQIARAGKELFKTNALGEGQLQSVKTLLEQLREANVQRDRELTELREELNTTHTQSRLDVIKKLLPVIDGLSDALTSGQQLLADQAETIEPPAPSFSQRLSAAWRALKGDYQTTPLSNYPTNLADWLTGLELVHDRLLDIFASEDVYPIDTEGEQFDPAYHVAIEAVAADDETLPGTIVQETRRGYVAGDEILRYAEVIVAR
jgi:molecular chaperone GrpE